jgi:C4-dicarboxylate transporter
MLYITPNNFLLNVITYNSKIDIDVSINRLKNLYVLSSLIQSYLSKDEYGSSKDSGRATNVASEEGKVRYYVCLALAKLILVVVFKESTIVSLDLLLNNSQVKYILTEFGIDLESDNLSFIRPINLG